MLSAKEGRCEIWAEHNLSQTKRKTANKLNESDFCRSTSNPPSFWINNPTEFDELPFENEKRKIKRMKLLCISNGDYYPKKKFIVFFFTR